MAAAHEITSLAVAAAESRHALRISQKLWDIPAQDSL
jgi:hypothetical protein